MRSNRVNISQIAKLFLLSGTLLVFVACSGSRQTINNESTSDISNDGETELVSDTGSNQTDPEPDTLSTEEQRTLDLKEVYREELFEKHNSEANQLVNYYILAQQKLFTGEYNEALNLVEKAAEIKENADILALRGSIYLGLGQPNEFVSNWRRALELDPEVPILPSPYVIQQLQLYGLIDENLRKNF